MPALRIATPCSANWAGMPGTDKVRHCPQCRLDVYNFSEMTPAEINQIIAARTGRLCARFYQRPDGMMLTEDCPEGNPARAQQSARIAAAALAALVIIAPAKASAALPQNGASSIQMQSARGGLTLQVRDPSGAVLPGAAVTLVNTKTGEHFGLTTDAKGELVLPDLSPGTYELAVTAAGFSTFIEKDLTVPGRAAVTLQLGAVMGEVVLVTGPGFQQTVQQSSSEIPTVLVEPRSANPDISLKPSDHRNALQRFFPKLHRVF